MTFAVPLITFSKITILIRSKGDLLFYLTLVTGLDKLYTREAQKTKQKTSGKSDYGLRSAVTGGAQMDGFVELFKGLVTGCGFSSEHIFTKKALGLPGFFRPTKEWDLLVVKDGRLIAAIEAKSQVGPSFGNNFNNRTEEAMGQSFWGSPMSLMRS